MLLQHLQSTDVQKKVAKEKPEGEKGKLKEENQEGKENRKEEREEKSEQKREDKYFLNNYS
jgi:hypothetical protein